MKTPFSIPTLWEDYQLLDSGAGMKREKWGEQILLRPEATASWNRKNFPSETPWHAQFYSLGNSTLGSWKEKVPLPSSWIIAYRTLHFLIRLTSSKQVGLFPEQAINWDWCFEKIKQAERPIKLLNLFGYTGAASLAALRAGASVCHVDASRAMVNWCAENRKLNFDHNKNIPLRLIVEDAMTFMTREYRRGNRYDAIILDPPAFGRSRSGKIWKLEDQLLSLLKVASRLLSQRPLFLMMNLYSNHFSEGVEFLEEVFDNSESSPISSISLGLQGSNDQKVIPAGRTLRWEAERNSH